MSDHTLRPIGVTSKRALHVRFRRGDNGRMITRHPQDGKIIIADHSWRDIEPGVTYGVMLFRANWGKCYRAFPHPCDNRLEVRATVLPVLED